MGMLRKTLEVPIKMLDRKTFYSNVFLFNTSTWCRSLTSDSQQWWRQESRSPSSMTGGWGWKQDRCSLEPQEGPWRLWLSREMEDDTQVGEVLMRTVPLFFHQGMLGDWGIQL